MGSFHSTMTFVATLSWREIKLIRRALELEGGRGSDLARKLSVEIEKQKLSALERLQQSIVELESENEGDE